MYDETVHFEIIAVCPDTPTDLKVIFDEGNIKLQWCEPIFDGGCEICSYEIWCKPDRGSWTLYGTVEDALTSIILTDMEEGFELASKAVNSVGKSKLSESISVEINSEDNQNKAEGTVNGSQERNGILFPLSLFLVMLISMILIFSRKGR